MKKGRHTKTEGKKIRKQHKKTHATFLRSAFAFWKFRKAPFFLVPLLCCKVVRLEGYTYLNGEWRVSWAILTKMAPVPVKILQGAVAGSCFFFSEFHEFPNCKHDPSSLAFFKSILGPNQKLLSHLEKSNKYKQILSCESCVKSPEFYLEITCLKHVIRGDGAMPPKKIPKSR